MAVAECCSKRVRRVGGRLAFQLENRYHHVLYLVLGSGTSANDGLFDLARGIFEDLDIRFECRAYGGGSGMAELEGAAGVLVYENTFYTPNESIIVSSLFARRNT